MIELGKELNDVLRVGQRATYGLANARNLLQKLHWEIRSLDRANRSNPTELYYIAFNAAVTAWHIGDWVWPALTEPQKKKIGEDWDLAINVKGDFLGALRKQNRCLAICREIATASKHFESTQNPDHEIDTVSKARAEPIYTSTGDVITAGEHRVVAPAWTLQVQDGDERADFVNVIREVSDFWHGFLDAYGIQTKSKPSE